MAKFLGESTIEVRITTWPLTGCKFATGIECCCSCGLHSPVLASTTEVCRLIGLMCRKEFSINLASQCTVACTAAHHRTSQTYVYHCPASQHGSIFDPLLGVSWLFRDAGSEHSVHEPSLWLARRFGTLYQTAWEIRILAETTSDVCWRRIYLHCTVAFSV